MAVFNCTKGSNINYYIDITCTAAAITIVCDMPENLSLGISSSWDSAMPYALAGLIDQIPGGIGGAIVAATTFGARVAGKAFNVQSQALSYQVWMGSDPIEIPLELQFDVKSDAKQDVWLPIAYLISLSMPRNQGSAVSTALGGVLLPPGPALGENGGKVGLGYGVNIRIGRIALFQDCIITGAEPNFSLLLDPDGYPIAGQVNLTIKTSYVYGNVDLLNALGIGVVA
jgi:hypothetical protein